MIRTHSNKTRAGDSCNAAPYRTVGLYGELQPLPLPVIAPLSSEKPHQAAPKQGLTG